MLHDHCLPVYLYPSVSVWRKTRINNLRDLNSLKNIYYNDVWIKKLYSKVGSIWLLIVIILSLTSFQRHLNNSKSRKPLRLVYMNSLSLTARFLTYIQWLSLMLFLSGLHCLDFQKAQTEVYHPYPFFHGISFVPHSALTTKRQVWY